MSRLSRPLSKNAVKKADAEFHAKHPELKGQPLSRTDPSQASLRREWVDLYKKHGGKVEPPKAGSKKVGKATASCPSSKKKSPLKKKGSQAFKRDSKGNIKAKKVGGITEARHNGAPGEIFVIEKYELELKDGSTIEAFKNLGKYDPATGIISPDNRMDTDCHGATFTDGEYWINDDQVAKTLSGGGFTPTTSPQPGDVAVFHNTSGNVVHSVTVHNVDASGAVTSVKGLGGLETTEHIDSPPSSAWGDPRATIEYYTK